MDVWSNPCLPLMFIDDPHRMKPMAMLAMKVAMQGGDLSNSCVPKRSELPELLVTTFRAAWDEAPPVIRADFLYDVVNITNLADCMQSIDLCATGYVDVLAPPWLAAEGFTPPTWLKGGYLHAAPRTQNPTRSYAWARTETSAS